jgi:hypothetical protein
MAISLGFGILFATAVTLVLVPANVLIVNDIKQFLKKITGHMEESSAVPVKVDSLN